MYLPSRVQLVLGGIAYASFSLALVVAGVFAMHKIDEHKAKEKLSELAVSELEALHPEKEFVQPPLYNDFNKNVCPDSHPFQFSGLLRDLETSQYDVETICMSSTKTRSVPPVKDPEL